MPVNTSPNMLLPIPVVGQEASPQWAADLNNSLTLVDQHNHTPGYGVQIPAAGLNITSDLTLNNSNLIGIKSLRIVPGSIISGPADLDALFVNGVDLYYKDGVGNTVRMTQSGGVAGTPGSIANLTSPASATYVSGSQTFVWQSDVNTPANMDNASIILRNLVANSFGLTLNPPAAMGANFSLTLPNLPASQKIMTLDASGNMSAPYTVDNTSIAIVANVIQVKNTNISTVTIDTTVTPATSDYLVDTTAGNITMTLPTAVGGSRPYVIKKISNDSNKVIIATTAGQTVDGQPSGTPQLTAINDSITLQSDTANFIISTRSNASVYGMSALGSNQTLTSGSDTQVSITPVNGANINTVSNAIVILFESFYAISGNLNFTTNGAGLRSLSIKVNGTEIIGSSSPAIGAGINNRLSASTSSIHLLAGDVVSMFALQTSGGSLDLDASNINNNSLSISRVGVIGGV